VARRHGRNAQVYVGVTSGAAASPVAFQASWTINMVTEKSEVTAFGDGNKIYVAGLPDASGDFNGFYDDATSQTYIAATDGQPRNFYLYPDTVDDPSMYFFGTILPDFSTDGAINGPINVKATWNAASRVQRYSPLLGLNA
jgi:hypothetical protein